MDNIFLYKILVWFLLLESLRQEFFMTDVSPAMHVLLFYNKKASTKQFNCFQEW